MRRDARRTCAVGWLTSSGSSALTSRTRRLITLTGSSVSRAVTTFTRVFARMANTKSRRAEPIPGEPSVLSLGVAAPSPSRQVLINEPWYEAWKPRSGSALAETERLSASERPSKVRNRKTGPRGWWPGPKGQRVGSPDGTTGDGDTNSRRTKGRSRPGRISPSGNRVSPTRPVARRKPDRKGG